MHVVPSKDAERLCRTRKTRQSRLRFKLPMPSTTPRSPARRSRAVRWRASTFDRLVALPRCPFGADSQAPTRPILSPATPATAPCRGRPGWLPCTPKAPDPSDRRTLALQPNFHIQTRAETAPPPQLAPAANSARHVQLRASRPTQLVSEEPRCHGSLQRPSQQSSSRLRSCFPKAA